MVCFAGQGFDKRRQRRLGAARVSARLEEEEEVVVEEVVVEVDAWLLLWEPSNLTRSEREGHV